MKPFDLELAKAGHPVRTRDGRKARIICFDAIQTFNQPVVALIKESDYEKIVWYTNKGKYSQYENENESTEDLCMASTKKTVWVNLYKMKNGENFTSVHQDKEYAEKNIGWEISQYPIHTCIGTFPIEFEE